MFFLSWLGSLLGGPLVRAALDAYRAKLEAGTNVDTINADLASRELQVQIREMELATEIRKVELGRWWEPDKLMGYAVAVYFGKILIWDKVLRLGVTDELGGWAGTTATVIVGAYFGKRGFENIVRIMSRRK
jgi:hypothetical protein